MAKRRQEDPPAGSPAWMATFSDLMNLLLCFFVLLFSMSTVDEEKYNEILTKQREWIAEKEAQAEENRAEVGGGTFAPVIYNDTLATLTMERCEELIEYLK